MRLHIEDLIIKAKIQDMGKIKAIITVDFGDFLVKGFRIIKSEYENERGDKLWFIPPSYLDKRGEYHPLFYIPDKELWKKLETRVWEAYYEQADTHFKKIYEIDQKEEEDTISL